MKYLRLSVVVLLLMMLCASCDSEASSSSSTLVLNLASNQFVRARSLTLSSSELAIDRYHITGQGPNDQSFALDSSEETISIGNLGIGSWNLHAEAFNAQDICLASGDMTAFLSKATSSATLHLTDLVGTGSLKATITWNIEQVSTDVSIEATLLDQSGNTIVLPSPVLDTVNGSTIVQAELASGSYLLQLKLYSQGILVSGAAQAVRIIDTATSDGLIDLVIGDLSTTFSVLLINDTMLPIEGTIASSPENPGAGQNVELTYTPTNLPADLSVEDLKIDWYCEGELVAEDSAVLSSIPAAGTHRYDVIVSHERLGSLGSSTLLVTMPY
ncbi:MAG: hypothetical protein AB7C91_10530 [Sphaerochaeta sp.]|uniref:hypothetical protein n=1 Tax=Sphaerochaeta sp. TaxID=1972642 RepID=UPI003D11E1FF